VGRRPDHTDQISVLIVHSSIDSMDITKSRPQNPKIEFRVLIIGRANAGKTTILKRVCDTTKSPTIHRRHRFGLTVVRHRGLATLPILSYATQVELDPSIEVSYKRGCLLSPLNSDSAWRAQHRRRTCVLQPYGLCFSRLTWYRVWWHRRSRNIAGVHSTQD